MMGTRRLEAACFRVSVLEMKLNTTATVDSVGLDPVNIVPYQKTRQLRDRPLILQQIRGRRPRTGKLHRLRVVAQVDVQTELIQPLLSVDSSEAHHHHPYLHSYPTRRSSDPHHRPDPHDRRPAQP